MVRLYPLRFEEILKEKIWGGRKLADMFGKPLPPDTSIGESWEISDRQGDQSVVADGPLKGATLHELTVQYGERLVGSAALANGKFPLLFKIIDAGQRLSVQVHPNDELAIRYNEPDPGKTEMWYVLAAEEGAQLMLGLQAGVRKREFREAVQAGRLEQQLNYVTVKAGDALFLSAGCVHAIGAGIVLAEIQENSDLTYRVYDWGRVGADGKPRELHLDKALTAINFDALCTQRAAGVTVTDGDNSRTVLAACRYFASEIVDVGTRYSAKGTGHTFTIAFFVQGGPRILWEGGELEARAGRSVLIPAELHEWRVEGPSRFLKFYVPDLFEDIVRPLTERGISARSIKDLGGNPVTGDVAAALSRWKGAHEHR